MEVCNLRSISNLPNFRSCKATKQFFNPPKPSSIFVPRQGLKFFKGSLKSTNSEEISTGTSLFVKNEPDSGINLGDEQPSEEDNYRESTLYQSPEGKPVSAATVEDIKIVDETVKEETEQDNAFDEGYPSDLQKQIADFVGKLNQKFESEDSYPLVLLGGTAATTLYLASAIIGAIDSVPILPKLMEAVGLGYTVWFSSRYLLFKENRDELALRIEELKQQVIGSKNE